MSYSETINYLYNLRKYGIKFGLENITQLMSAFANPHLSFLSVHVAGTNGKGSTSAIIAAIFQTAGLKVGLFTSPHLINFTERIKVNGEEISGHEVINLTDEIKDITTKIGDFYPTFFEVVTAMAMLYFKRKNIDIAVIEVGMGGRLDATNIIMPEVSVITNISFDHKEFLGRSLKEIANEKAGIIKKGIPVLVSSQDPEAMDVIKRKAEEKDAELYIYGRNFFTALKKEDLSGISFDYRDNDSMLNDLELPLIGLHQMENASVAIKTVKIISNKINSKFSPSPTPPIKGGESQGVTVEVGEHTPAPLSRGDLPSPLAGEGKGEGDNKPLNPNWSHFIRNGLKNVKWPGRLEIIEGQPLILIDGAHNPAASEAISISIKKVFMDKFKKIIIVLGIMSDKDIKGVMEPLLTVASEIILTSPAYSRAATPEKLAGIAESMGFFNIKIVPTVKDALGKAKEAALNDSSLIVITGSFYTIGEAKEVLGSKGILTTLRE
ncbi:MAG: bifunctional folylpolyglutamate synthase/dihydrofolate synthase [Nitrospirae bacterium]|jgi:dihydrofolate synthase / folylpolyglutamate synthase|nr:bifunctional folylpolyglutamate synthase/dihydrofolate synthase [Nitrospirota bacterium]